MKICKTYLEVNFIKKKVYFWKTCFFKKKKLSRRHVSKLEELARKIDLKVL